MLIILPNRPLSPKEKLITNGYIPSINTSVYTPKSIKNFSKLNIIYLAKISFLLD